MRTYPRFAIAFLLALALVASACSGGDDNATAPVTTAAPAQLPDAVGDMLFDMLFEAPPTTSTTTPADRIKAEEFVSDLVYNYFEAAAAREWDAVYEAASSEFKEVCTPGEYAAITSAATAPIEIVIEAGELQVVGDFATGSFEIADANGSMRVEGLLASWASEGWRVTIDPCDVAARVVSGDFSYPVVLTTTTLEPPPADAADNPTTEASIPAALTTTTTAPSGGSTTTTTADITGPNPEGEGTTTTTSLPPVPLTAADRVAIEAIVEQFLVAETARDYPTLHASVPPLFTCTAGETATALDPFHWSPTTVTFGDFTITGANDEAFASFDITFTDTGETLTVTDFGSWEWGGVWYAAVHPCKWRDLEITDGTSNQFVIDLMNDTLALARTLYAGAGDYDIPTATLNALSDTVEWVGTADQAGEGKVAYVDADQELLILTQSASGRWYCIAEDAVLGEHYGSAALASSVDTIAGCRSVAMTNPFGPPAP
ncbi:MAG: hypothetical protein ACR2OI_00725 [Acidimicrobiia bacterium]